jgi:hypothetical protein
MKTTKTTQRTQNTQIVKIESIKIVKKIDEYPDLSYLGEYSNTPAAVCIDRKERNEQGGNEFRYFNLGCGDAEYIEQDYKRMEAYNQGNWCMLGIYAEAVVKYPIGNGGYRLETLSSGGLGGIESDSDKDFIQEVIKEQLDDLFDHLKTFNIDTTNFIELAEEAKNNIDN